MPLQTSTPESAGAPVSEVVPLTVGQLTDRIKAALEDAIPPLWIEGEISNFRRAASDHLYFTLKDERAQISAVMFRYASQTLPFEPENGMKVLCHVEISVYAPRGQYQVKVLKMRPDGVGELQLRFEQLKKKLEGEGLFEAARKRPIPFLPRRIGVVTSATGAAIRDIISVLTRRYPGIGLVVHPVKVQGDGSAGEIARAIETLGRRTDLGLDVLIVGRGGGSIEDLWAFNEEVVARAIYASTIPVISAVGHEVDFTIADFVADRRAPTPSAAAEMAVPDRRDLDRRIANLRSRLASSLGRRADLARRDLRRLVRQLLTRPRQLIDLRFQQVDDLLARAARSCHHVLRLKAEGLRATLNRLEPLSPLETLERGYALAWLEGNRVPLTEAGRLKRGSRIVVQLARGQVLCQVLATGDDVEGETGTQGRLPGL